MMSASSSAGNRFPFTATQWQELEHQALIYKYMVSGVPIPPELIYSPPELIYSVKRSLDSSLASRFLPHQPIGWGSFQVGFGRKADPEPGRCRRTDGKKWRCSKEAYPDSKYCERHMHRGRNRSRKPVELSSSSSSSSTTTTTKNPFTAPSPPINSSSYSISTLSSSMSPDQNTTHFNPRPPGSCFPQDTTANHMFLDHTDKRYLHGSREGADERVFFPETSGTTRSSQDYNCQPLISNSSYGRYCQPQLQSFDDKNAKHRQQHCFVLGTDFGSIKLEKDGETQKPLHDFFEEWPPKSTDSWLDLASTSSRLQNDS